MQMKLKQWIAVGLLAAGSSAALAGLVSEVPVTVTLNADGSGSAFGSMTTARFSKNDVEFIGCGLRRIDIFQFCDPLTAKRMVEHDISFAAYLPCRIALVENAQGQVWLLMMNLDMFIQHPRFDPALKADAVRIRDMLLEIMAAGAAGDW